MKHRTDIDGLRAIAILAITLFHINPKVFKGGFIGVDVFFVISGYLITKSIWTELENSEFSIAGFYARRIRRLFPALLFALLVFSIAAYFLLLPPDLIVFSKSAAATVAYVSNMYFYSLSGYFDMASDSRHLLHTWSLAVEEQFYLVFPLFMMAVFAFARGSKFSLVAIAAMASLALSQYWMATDASGSFYLAPSRFWQFLLGSMVSICLPSTIQSRHAAYTGWAGLSLLAASLALYRETTPFPGIGAIPPTLATAMILASGQLYRGAAYGLLSNRLFRFYGLISYSMYLWHWPIIVFYKQLCSPIPNLKEQAFLLIASTVCGYLSYRFVERPTKNIKLDERRLRIVAAGLATSAVAVALFFYPIKHKGLPDRFDPEIQRMASYLLYNKASFRGGTCFLYSINKRSSEFRTDECINLKKNRPTLLLLGDSHAAHFAGAIRRLYPDYNFSQITASGCKPTLPMTGEERCTTLMNRAFKLIDQGHYSAVIVSALWRRGDGEGLQLALERMAGKTSVTVIGPTIEYSGNLPRLLAQASITGFDSPVWMSRDIAGMFRLDDDIERYVKSTSANYFSGMRAMCKSVWECQTITKDGAPMIFDFNHFTDAGAEVLLSGLPRDLIQSKNVSIEKPLATIEP